MKNSYYKTKKTYNSNRSSYYANRSKFDDNSDDRYDYDKVERAMSRGRSRDSYGDYWNDRAGW